jgi:putative ABC transport system permease protein
MNVFKIAWRSIQHRGLGSLLTIVSMALGVMMVVAVLSIHGLVSKSFKSNNSFGYNVLVGARGGGLQLTLNSVYYLSRPVENIPYEYYLAFCDKDERNKAFVHSIAYQTQDHIAKSTSAASMMLPGGAALGAALSESLAGDMFQGQQSAAMGNQKSGLYKRYTHTAVPICLGDYYVDPETGAAFRGVATKPTFFTELVLDIETDEKFEFAKGNNFQENSAENGFFECVIGSTVARRCDIKIGDKLKATHGDPNDDSSHIHDQNFTVTGILKPTNTPNDRVVFFNMEGFFLIEDHIKPVENDAILDTEDRDSEDDNVDEAPDAFDAAGRNSDAGFNQVSFVSSENQAADDAPQHQRIPLPVEQREVTSVLVRTSLNDPFNVIGTFLPGQINEGDLETTLDWTPYRPERSQKAAQAVNPVVQVASLFALFVDPIRWLLLALTSMICVVSALSILVGIYNSMSQRQHEIAVMRALGANRNKVMLIMLCEAVLLALLGGGLGWIAGHSLNACLSPIVEARTGVQIGFFDLAPQVPLGYFLGGFAPENIASIGISPELLLIPGLMILAVLVGVYPAISAYRTDVSQSLGK